jgi:hypothetical protein
MSRFRSIGRSARLLVLLTPAPFLLAGCGDSAGPTWDSVQRSPDEVKRTKQELKKAMLSGAYGAAGKKSASTMGD